MRKILIVARREFLAAVKTKAFIIGLLIMPVLMGGSIVVQLLLKDVHDTKPRTYAVLDRTPGANLLPVIEKAVKEYNETKVADPTTGKQINPRFVIDPVKPEGDSVEEVNRLRLALSERVRKGELSGFAEIGRDVAALSPASPTASASLDDYVVRYQSNRITQREFRQLIETTINEEMRSRRREQIPGLTERKLEAILQPVPLVAKGLSRVNAEGHVEDSSEQSQLAGLFVPGAMMMLMFMVVMMVANPMLQGVVEEKMQRIAEVLLGSVQPFELMLGKLLGMTAVSLTIASVYLGGGYWAAWRYGFADFVAVDLLIWFLVYQALAGLMYGSLFIAIGAACTDMKEAQNMLLPVSLLVCMPLFILGSVIQEPNSPVVTGLSFFPFATPMLMIARQSAPPGIPLWQPLAGVAVVVATTLLCVWAAGRIFRVGLLMQGKGARVGEMLRWVFKG
jgi:ABC-2 type transport system permease protein